MKPHFFIFFLCLSAIFTETAAQTIRVAGSEIASERVTEKQLAEKVAFLCSDICKGRATGSEGARNAAAWIARQLDSIGLKPFPATYTGKFTTPDGLQGQNVCAILDGGRKNSSYILITAHYDGLGTLSGNLYPGADSNASGVAGLLSAAEMMKFWTWVGRKYHKNLIFAALDGKYHGHAGASALWNDISSGILTDPFTGDVIRKESIALAVNIDQIGASLSPPKSGRKDYLIMLSENGKGYMGQMLAKADVDFGTNLELLYDYYGSKDFTLLFYRKVCDHKVFLEGGCSCVMFTSGITLNNNKTTDLPSTLDYPVMLRRIRLIFHWLDRII